MFDSASWGRSISSWPAGGAPPKLTAQITMSCSSGAEHLFLAGRRTTSNAHHATRKCHARAERSISSWLAGKLFAFGNALTMEMLSAVSHQPPAKRSSVIMSEEPRVRQIHRLVARHDARAIVSHDDLAGEWKPGSAQPSMHEPIRTITSSRNGLAT